MGALVTAMSSPSSKPDRAYQMRRASFAGAMASPWRYLQGTSVGRPDLVIGAAIVRRMALPDLELAGRFVAVVYDLTSGQPGRFRRIDDCAKRAGIKRRADIAEAVAAAE